VDGGDVAVDDLHGAVAATGGGFQLRAARPPGGDLIDGAVAAEPEDGVQQLVRLGRFRRRARGRGRRRGGRVAGCGDLVERVGVGTRASRAGGGGGGGAAGGRVRWGGGAGGGWGGGGGGGGGWAGVAAGGLWAALRGAGGRFRSAAAGGGVSGMRSVSSVAT